MCLHPITIRNPTRRISKAGGQRLLMQVRCNHCAECQRAIRREWYFRSYQEVRHTLAKGGYVYFDTLTYADEHLPHLSNFIDIAKYGIKDMSCFDHSHFRLFLKNLRRQLQYHCGNSSFKYFLTTEYGLKYTKRPHYHILFYVTSGVSPFTFSRMVAKCWKYGRTDGIPYQPMVYVQNHVFGNYVGKVNSNDYKAVTSACNYVSKYVTKSSKFRKSLQKRIDILCDKIDNIDDVKALQRNVDMFHRQSQGFGASYLDNMLPVELDALSRDECIMESKDKVVETYPLPMYYKRRLYYENKKPDPQQLTFNRYWEKTDIGIQHDNISMPLRVARKVKDYQTILLNSSDEVRSSFVNMLNSRSLEDLAVYELFYKDRLRIDFDTIYNKVRTRTLQPGLTDVEYNLYDWLKYLDACNAVNSVPLTDIVIVDQVSQNVYYKQNYIPYEQFIRTYTINQQTDSCFSRFDDCISILSVQKMANSVNKQATFDYKEEQKELLKLMNYGY